MTIKEMHSAPATTVEGARIRPHRTTIWLWLTAPIAVLLAIAAASGVFVADLYRDPPSLAAQAVGQDVVTLAVALPALVISAIVAGRGSARGRLVWLGVVAYVVYTSSPTQSGSASTRCSWSMWRCSLVRSTRGTQRRPTSPSP